MHIAREVGSLLTNVDDVIEARRAVAAAVRPLRAARARTIIAEAVRSLDDEARSLALPVVERLPLRCRPPLGMLAAPVYDPAPVQSLRVSAKALGITRRTFTMGTKDMTLVQLGNARRRIGISERRMHLQLRKRGITPVRVGVFAFIPEWVVGEIEQANRAWRNSKSYRRWVAKTGHQSRAAQ